MTEQISINPEKYFLLAQEDYQRMTSFKPKAKKPSDFFGKYNKKTRAYLLFPLLEEHGITTWEQLDDEQRLIDNKESKLSRLVRDAITHLHTHCLIKCAEETQNTVING